MWEGNLDNSIILDVVIIIFGIFLISISLLLQ